ncbi:MAG: DUF3530 family protein [Neptuniibacter sp.]
MKRILIFLSLCITLASSASFAADEPEDASTEPAASGAVPSSPPKPRTEPDIDKTIISNLLQLAPPETEVLQLDTGKNDEKLIAYYQPEGSGIKQGGIIIFPDEHTHLDWPGDLNYLREGLTDFGWHTLAIYLPRASAPPVPKRTLPVLQAISKPSPGEEPKEAGEEANNATSETDATPVEQSKPVAEPQSEKPQEPREPYHEKSTRLGQTAYRYLQQQGVERFVVMGIGTGATWATQYVKQFQDSQDLRLVLIDARQPRTVEKPILMELLPDIKTTIIDLYHDARIASHPLNTSAEKRLRLSRQKLLTNFHQSRLPTAHDDWKRHNPWLLKHVRGLLNTYVIKMEKQARDVQLNKTDGSSGEKAPGMKKNN